MILMKHKVTVDVETTKNGLFGKKKVIEKKTIWVDGKTYRELQKRQGSFTIEELMFYDCIFDD